MEGKKQINAEELEKVNGGYFVVYGGGSSGSGTAPTGNAYKTHYRCKSCQYSWTKEVDSPDASDTSCPSCGSTDLYTYNE